MLVVALKDGVGFLVMEYIDGETVEEKLRAGPLKMDPRFDPIRSDPRYQALLRRIGLPA